MHEWFVAKIRPNKEASVITTLGHWDVETFYPQFEVDGRVGRRREALFPSYLFCSVDKSSPLWPRIRWAPGLAYFLGSDGPAAVPEQLVAHLRDRVREWDETHSANDLAQGQPIEVTSGPFAGMDGIFDRYVPARQRCQVLLNTMSGPMMVEMPRAGVRAFGRAQIVPT